jgi:predicted transposase
VQQIITAKLKLIATLEQHQLLRQTQLAYRDALNYVSQYAFTCGKISNVQKLHKGTYRDVRSLFGLPSQMACSVMRQVSASYKGLWTKLRRNLEHRKARYTRKRFKGLDKPPKYVSPTLIYVNGHDYGFKSDQRVNIMTLHGRITLPYQGVSSPYLPHPTRSQVRRSQALVRQSTQAVLPAGSPGAGYSSPNSRNAAKRCRSRCRHSLPCCHCDHQQPKSFLFW